MKRFTVLLALALLLVPLAGVMAQAPQPAQVPAGAHAGPGMGMGRGMGGGMGMGMNPARFPGPLLVLRLAEKLGLSADQQAKLKSLNFSSMREQVKQSSQLELIRVDIAEILATDPVDMNKAAAKIKEAAGLQAEMKIKALRTGLEVRSILTADQLKKLETLHPKRAGGGPRAGAGPGAGTGAHPAPPAGK